MINFEFLNNALGVIVSVLVLAGFCGYAYSLSINSKKKSKVHSSDHGISNENEGESSIVSGSTVTGGSGAVNIIGSNNTVIAKPAESPDGDEKSKVAVNLKSSCQILFIDDEKTPSVIKTLKKSGWKNISKIDDTADLDIPAILNADIIFVDIKGVGKELGFKNEGLGLAAQIKRKYPEKGVIIYSATPEHNLFDPDIRVVNDMLYKNAEPIQFHNMIEKHAKFKN